jgi:SNF2 family DNA or RNA helicase
MIEDLSLMKQTKKGSWVRSPVTIERRDDRIYFFKARNVLETPFELKNEIKAMQGYRWHGHRDDGEGYCDGLKVWSAADCIRNNFQLDYMRGLNPYVNWDKPLEHFEYSRPLYDHQKLMADHCLTYHYKILAAEMGVGKTLSAIETMEKSGFTDWWWVAPKSGLAAVEREFDKWGLTVQPKLMTYDRLRIDIERWESGWPAPRGVIFDESSRLKSGRAKRSLAALHLADAVRREYGWAGYVILMSGTPSPKSPVDWWSQCEICYPGFLKEGTDKAFEWRLGIFEQQYTDSGKFWKRKTWRDDVNKCEKCGEYADHPNHEMDDIFGMGENAHDFEPSKNEVAYMHERLDGLVLPLAKKDCLDIPEKIYREVVLEPTSTLKRVAKALAASAVTAIQGLTWLRELSDGFQYRQVQDGMKPCPVCDGKGECEQWFRIDDGEPADQGADLSLMSDEDDYEKRLATCERCEGAGEVPRMVRETKKLRCPKEGALRDLLEENEDQGRLVVFAGFQGSVDRIIDLCHAQQWDVVRVDGRGWKIMRHDGDPSFRKTKPLDYWVNMDNDRVVFVAHPESGGMGLTLTESRMAVFYSNDFKPESRSQAEDRIHRPGIDMNKGATIVDLFHLGTDRKVLDVLRDNRRLEKLTLGEMREML